MLLDQLALLTQLNLFGGLDIQLSRLHELCEADQTYGQRASKSSSRMAFALLFKRRPEHIVFLPETLPRKGIKVCVAVEVIFILCSLESADNNISKGCHQCFDTTLEEIIGQCQREKKTPRKDAEG